MTFQKIGFFERPYRHAQRYRQVLSILFRYGFADLVESLGIENFLEISLSALSRHRKEKLETYTRSERLRMALEELGPTFIKLGQILSTRADLLPGEIILELEKLQDNVPPFEFSQVKAIVEKDLKSPLDALFPSFEENPIASASLGQVHRARLKSGSSVAVKVQRPNIQRTIKIDMEILMHLATLMERHLEGWGLYNAPKLVEEMTATIEKELDYSVEAAYIERFGRNFRYEPTLYVPKVYREFSTSRVLTLEFIAGQRAAELDTLSQNGLDGKELAHRLAGLIMKQVFEHGFFHADLHPGNIYFLPENIICFLDFGMMGRVDRKSREDFSRLVIAVANRDEAGAVDALLRLTRPQDEDEEPDELALQRDTADFMDQHLYRPLKEIDLGKLLRDMLDMTARHRLRFSPNLFMMLKSLSAVEGLCKNLDPEFDLVQRAEPYVRRLRMERFHPSRLSQEVMHAGGEVFELLRDIPGDIREILVEAKRGKLNLEFRHRGLEPLIATYDRSSKRLSFSVVLASLVVGSALIVLADVPPKLFNIPVIGILGFLFAGLMGFWLLISILRRGGM